MAAAPRRTFYDLRTEGEGIGREAAALGLGVFIGCTPFYGIHLLLCWLVGRLAHLNRLKLYLAANISNPLFSPVLIFSELQAGAWVRRGTFHDVSIETLRHVSPWTFGADILVGSVVVGGTIGIFTAVATYATGGLRRVDPLSLAVAAGQRPLPGVGDHRVGVCPRQAAGRSGVSGAGRETPSRVGRQCVGYWLRTRMALSVLVAASRLYDEGRWPLDRPPPRMTSAMGIEMRSRVAKIARRALAGHATIENGDARTIALPVCDTVLLFDVLHLLAHDEQEELLARVATVVAPGGLVLVREADASAGRAFTMVRFGNRVKALVVGRWRQRFYFRTHAEWAALLARHGFAVTARPADSGTPFANLLLRAVRDGRRSPLHDGSDLHHGRPGSGPLVVLSAKP